MVRSTTVDVLVVEDEAGARYALCEILAGSGYTVAAAANGRLALDLLQSRRTIPGVILLDLAMPVLDGWGFREVQLRNPALAALPVILISGESDLEAHARRLRIGAFLPKPLAIDDLLQLLPSILTVTGQGAASMCSRLPLPRGSRRKRRPVAPVIGHHRRGFDPTQARNAGPGDEDEAPAPAVDAFGSACVRGGTSNSEL